MEESTSRCTNISGTLRSGDVKLYVIAGTYQIFRDWCYLHGISPRNGRKVWFVMQPRQLMGVRNGVVVVAAKAYEQKHYHELLERARIADMEIINDVH